MLFSFFHKRSSREGEIKPESKVASTSAKPMRQHKHNKQVWGGCSGDGWEGSSGYVFFFVLFLFFLRRGVLLTFLYGSACGGGCGGEGGCGGG